MQNRDDELLESIDRMLSLLVNLTAYQIAQGKTIAEGAPLLRRLGLRQGEIAAIFNTTVNTIGVRLAEARKRPRGRRSE